MRAASRTVSLSDRAELLAAFIKAAESEKVGFLTMGKLRYEIEQTLLPEEEIYVVLQAAGASKSSISNAKYSRDAWGLVIDGKIADRDFWQLGFHQCRTLSRLTKHPIPLEILRAGEAAGLDHEEVIALGKWDLKGDELNALARKCAERGLVGSVIVAGAMTGVLPESNSARKEALGSGCKLQGPAAPVSSILRWYAKIGGVTAIDEMDIFTVRNLGDILLPLLPILSAITKRLREEKRITMSQTEGMSPRGTSGERRLLAVGNCEA